MKIAIASQDRVRVSGHVGHCQCFWLYELADGRVVQRTLVELAPEQTFHASHHSIPAGLQGMDVLVAAVMGPGLRDTLSARGIGTVATDEVDLEVVALKAAAGRLADVPARVACGCGGHAH
jgi:predicted Fe-Mo cluster-binding NifX family protein